MREGWRSQQINGGSVRKKKGGKRLSGGPAGVPAIGIHQLSYTQGRATETCSEW